MAAGQRVYGGVGQAVAELGLAAVAATLLEAEAQNLSGGDIYLQIHDAAGAAVPGAQPMYSFLLQDKQVFAFAPPGDDGRPFMLGIVVAWSTTFDTFTSVAPTFVGPLYGCARLLA